jgi:hypothetical protein
MGNLQSSHLCGSEEGKISKLSKLLNGTKLEDILEKQEIITLTDDATVEDALQVRV